MRHRRMRMQTEKSFVMVLAALITLMAMVACGGGAGSSADQSEEAAKAEEAAVAAGYVPAARMAEHIDQDVTIQGTVADYIRVTGSGSGKPTLPPLRPDRSHVDGLQSFRPQDPRYHRGADLAGGQQELSLRIQDILYRQDDLRDGHGRDVPR